MSSLAPPIPLHFGPHRRKALERSQRGWCAVCDDLPIPWGKNDRNGRKGHRFTCQRAACVKGWNRLCQLDYRHARRRKAPPSGLVHRKAAG